MMQAGDVAIQVSEQESAFRACLAATAAERLAFTALKAVLDTTDHTAEVGLLVDQFYTCASATARVARAISVSREVDVPTLDLAITTLARMNNRCRQQTGREDDARRCLLLDVAEQLLEEHVRQFAPATSTGRRTRKRKAWRAAAVEAAADKLIDVILHLAGEEAPLAVHLLIGTAIIALGQLCREPG